MLKIGNQVFRNLPEQVEYNSEQIKKIADYIDGLDLADSVLVLDNISIPLTAEQLAVVNRPVAFIVYNGNIYIKRDVDSTKAYFDIIFTVSQNTEIEISTSIIEVTLSNGALGITNTTYNLYSKDQMDIALAGKADLAGAEFSGAVKAPTLEQTNANYAVDFTFPSGSTIQITNIYNRFEVINNVLYIIANIKMKNISASSVNVGGGWGSLTYVVVNLDHNIASKIFDLAGNSVAVAATNSLIVCGTPALCLKGDIDSGSLGAYHTVRFDLTNRNTADQCAVYFQSDQTITLAANEELVLTARMALTLI